MSNVEQWLKALGLSKYSEVFTRNAVDWKVLQRLDEQDLERLGVTLADRKHLLKAIAELPQVLSSPKFVTGAERRQITVLFSDLVGSTALSVELDPEDLVANFGRICRGLLPSRK